MAAVKILIIKLGAKGDVVRTLPILIALKEKYPDSEISWLTKKDSVEILKKSPYISKIYTIPEELNEEFDLLYNFDIEKEATDLAKKILAKNKFGFSEDSGYPTAFNSSAEYYLNTLFDDELKKQNRKTYQEMMFEVAELPYKKQHYPLALSKAEREYAEEFAEKNKINKDKIIGIHMGASPRWPSKVWHKDNLKEFIKKAKKQDYDILVLGGPDEIKEHEKLKEEMETESIKIHFNNPNNTDSEFISLISLCTVIICSDSFSLHIALALKKPTIGLFFVTSPNEVEDYGILKKKVSPLLDKHFYSDEYSEELVKSISAQEIIDSLKELKDRK